MKTFCKLGFGLLAYCLAIAAVMAWAAAAQTHPLGPAAMPLFNAPLHLPEMVAGGLLVNQANLSIVFTGFKAAFNTGFRSAEVMWQRIATLTPSTTSEERYGWLGQFPQLREWVGDRHIKGMELHDYTIKNKPFEATIGVSKDNLEDDRFGVFSPLFQEMGYAAATHPDSLIWALLKDGFGQLCYDGQNFFDTDHPVGDGVVSNSGGGAGTPWFMLDTRRPLKPLIFQRRKDYQLESMVTPQDEAVFMRKEYRYGVDARVNVGFGFWQQAYGSKQALDAANYEASRVSMMSLKSEEGRPLGIMPNLLVVPPALEGAAKEILVNERLAGGETNKWRGTAELLVVPWLA